MGTLQRQGGAVAGVGAFHYIVCALKTQTIQLNETTSQRLDRDSRAAALRDALRAIGPASAGELAERTGISSKRIGGILSHDVAAGRVVAWRDKRTRDHAPLTYALAPRRGEVRA
jgi:hypothetical protein